VFSLHASAYISDSSDGWITVTVGYITMNNIYWKCRDNLSREIYVYNHLIAELSTGIPVHACKLSELFVITGMALWLAMSCRGQSLLESGLPRLSTAE